MKCDPVCGMEIEEAPAEQADLASEYEGQIYYFCSAECKAKFDHTPATFAQPATLEEQREDDEGGRPSVV